MAHPKGHVDVDRHVPRLRPGVRRAPIASRLATPTPGGRAPRDSLALRCLRLRFQRRCATGHRHQCSVSVLLQQPPPLCRPLAARVNPLPPARGRGEESHSHAPADLSSLLAYLGLNRCPPLNVRRARKAPEVSIGELNHLPRGGARARRRSTTHRDGAGARPLRSRRGDCGGSRSKQRAEGVEGEDRLHLRCRSHCKVAACGLALSTSSCSRDAAKLQILVHHTVDCLK